MYFTVKTESVQDRTIIGLHISSVITASIMMFGEFLLQEMWLEGKISFTTIA